MQIQTVLMMGLAIALVGLLGVMVMRIPVEAQKPNPAGVQAALSQLANDSSALKTLTVTYDDMHGLHGGLTLTLCGDGRIVQRAVRTKVGQPKELVSESEMLRLVAMLVDITAWEQRIPDAMPVPDESRALLNIVISGHTSTIWERYNDLAKGQRIVRIRDLMKQLAWGQGG